MNDPYFHRVIVAMAVNLPEEAAGRANEQLAQLERTTLEKHEAGWDIVSAITTTSVFGIVNEPQAKRVADILNEPDRWPVDALVRDCVSDSDCAEPRARYDDPMRREILVILGLSSAFAACGGSTPLPLDVEIKDGAAVAGGKWDQLELVVKSLPGAEVQVGTEKKSMEATRAVEHFTVPKSGLKLGKNSFVVRAEIAALFSKREAEKKVEWDA